MNYSAVAHFYSDIVACLGPPLASYRICSLKKLQQLEEAHKQAKKKKRVCLYRLATGTVNIQSVTIVIACHFSRYIWLAFFCLRHDTPGIKCALELYLYY